jgi:hypothetical protein
MKLNRNVFRKYTLGSEPKPYIYWLQQSIESRIEAIEFLRQQYHTEDEIQSRLQRVYRITKRSSS